MSDPTLHLLGPWRCRFQWLTTLALLAIPWVRIDGGSLLRLDLTTLTLHLAGLALQIEELYLFLLFCIALVLVFLLTTMVLGRAWCGWACPQTTLSDLAEWAARQLGLRITPRGLAGSLWRKLVLQFFFLLLALLVGANLVWYFITPYEFLARMLAGTLGPAATTTLIVTAATVYLDLALVRRLMCREFCPYGRFQTVLVDPGTLTLRFHPDHAVRCIQCGACVRACPMGIDIRRGFQIECINCGRCLDACREVMTRRQDGIIRYTFGLEGRGWRALLNPRILLVAVACVVVVTGFMAAALSRPQATLKLARSASAAPRPLEDGRMVTFFTGVVANRTRELLIASLQARTDTGTPIELRGPVTAVAIPRGERRHLDFAVVTSNLAQRLTIEIILNDEAGGALAVSRAFLEPIPRSPHDP
jgi:cytochrome c oxidase accessory protein FixG